MKHFGPLAHLAGEWEGDSGVDFSFHHADGLSGDTPYRQTSSHVPFGPVDNGTQSLYGLDYKSASWRMGEQDPFHTELGYWLWCKDLSHVMLGFVIPRGATVLAGGKVDCDATEFTLRAERGQEVYGISSNAYLAEKASTVSFEITVKVDGDTLTYEQDSVLELAHMDEPLHHTDRNVLKRVKAYEIPPYEEAT